MYNNQSIQEILLNFNESFKEHRENASALLQAENHLWLASDETSTIERLSIIDTSKFVQK